jgi:hypothetical protein
MTIILINQPFSLISNNLKQSNKLKSGLKAKSYFNTSISLSKVIIYLIDLKTLLNLYI